MSSALASFRSLIHLILIVTSTDRHVCSPDRQLCILLSAEQIFRTLAASLRSNTNLDFVSLMIRQLNTILMTSAELYELRTDLRQLSTEVSQLLPSLQSFSQSSQLHVIRHQFQFIHYCFPSLNRCAAVFHPFITNLLIHSMVLLVRVYCKFMFIHFELPFIKWKFHSFTARFLPFIATFHSSTSSSHSFISSCLSFSIASVHPFHASYSCLKFPFIFRNYYSMHPRGLPLSYRALTFNQQLN